jgi:glycosyltransferase involved in cell wall biosynthesis
MSTTDVGRVAIVHDALVTRGGAERVVLFMMRTLPNADLFTSAYLPANTYSEFRGHGPRTFPWLSWIRSERQLKLAWPALIAGFRRLDLRGYDTVLCSSAYAAKAVQVSKPSMLNLYCYAPFRLLWSPESYLSDNLRIAKGLAGFGLAPLRAWDTRVTRRADRIATTCRNMAERIESCYKVEPAVIPAPIEWSAYRASSDWDSFYLVVSRLNRYKRIDLAVAACNRLRRKLLIVGDGPLRASLTRMAGPTVQFLGRVADVELRTLYRQCRALIFPADEDYGLVPLEAQASGRPVIAFGRGGALETVEEGRSGLFFEEQTEDHLVAAIERCEATEFSSQEIRLGARRFDVSSFSSKLSAFLTSPIGPPTTGSASVAVAGPRERN